MAADLSTSFTDGLGQIGPLYRFVVDDRFADCIEAGRIAAQRGATLEVVTGGDVTPFWFHDLSLRWREAPAVVAGVTAHGPLFVLEHLAGDYGMRVISRNAYPRTEAAGNGEPLFSWLIGPGSGLSRVPAR